MGGGARDFRQGMITLACEFIAPDESFACADKVLAEAADCYGFSFFLTFVTLTTLTFPSTVQLVHLFLLSLV